MSNKGFIPVYKPCFNGNEKKYLIDCIESGWISSKGKYVGLFEKEFSRFLGSGYSAAVANGTVALHLALEALNISSGDEVIVPSFTYIASVNAIKYCGAKPVFVDSEIDNWNIDPTKVEDKITSKTKAIIAVHLYGAFCNMYELRRICKKHSIFLIEDSAEAFGSTLNDSHAGTFGDISTFSFFGNKTITTGEGGMVTSQDNKLIEKVNYLKSQAVDPNKEYWHPHIGYNYRMTNMQAAIGLAQLENCSYSLKRKLEIAEIYKRELRKYPLSFQKTMPNSVHSYWMVSVMCDSEEHRDALRNYLKEVKIETRPHFFPAHIMPPYNVGENYCVAEEISRRGLTLPSFPSLSKEEIKYIIEKIKYYFDQ